MSRERQRARAAREAERLADVEAQKQRRDRQARRAALAARLTPRRPRREKSRQKRYGALPTGTRVRLVTGYVAVQLVVWYFLHGIGPRFSVAVLTAAVLLIAVKTQRSTR